VTQVSKEVAMNLTFVITAINVGDDNFYNSAILLKMGAF
jgi:hypothetical protein